MEKGTNSGNPYCMKTDPQKINWIGVDCKDKKSLKECKLKRIERSRLHNMMPSDCIVGLGCMKKDLQNFKLGRSLINDLTFENVFLCISYPGVGVGGHDFVEIAGA